MSRVIERKSQAATKLLHQRSYLNHPILPKTPGGKMVKSRSPRFGSVRAPNNCDGRFAMR
jgi:hypothetical protein